ncbi:MAG: nuclear transport factor 2 family protein [Oscillospiraceae bacterium]|nr:nuclear transport factor 2 family protein [Oscillospiraceae bacterium]
MEQNLTDVLVIKDLIERWVVYRDALMWDKFRTLWRPGGTMTATWTTGTYEDFIKITETGVKNGLNIQHILGGSAVEVNGGRAVSMTKFIILQRAVVDGVLCDVTCYARHYDLWEKADGKWGLKHRTTIADKDRIDPVDKNQTLALDKELLERFPMEYRHLAYLQTRAGYTVDRDCPRMSGGPALEALYKSGDEWLNNNFIEE